MTIFKRYHKHIIQEHVQILVVDYSDLEISLI